MRQVYLRFKKCRTLFGELSWNHYVVLSRLVGDSKMNYYLKISERLNLSIRELKKRIKNNEYERIGKIEELEEPKANTLIKNPIIIKTNKEIKKVSEYILHNLILEDIDNFLKELGVGFTYVGSEVKIKIGDRYYRIDFLLFNTEYNCYVVIELKITEMKPEYIGQVLKYINYVDKHIKKIFHEQTVGVIICKKNNELIMEYCTNPSIFTTVYELETI